MNLTEAGYASSYRFRQQIYLKPGEYIIVVVMTGSIQKQLKPKQLEPEQKMLGRLAYVCFADSF